MNNDLSARKDSKRGDYEDGEIGGMGVTVLKGFQPPSPPTFLAAPTALYLPPSRIDSPFIVQRERRSNVWHCAIYRVSQKNALSEEARL